MNAFYAPADWLAEHTTARGRRATGFWTVLLAATGAIFLGNQVFYVTILSVIALIPNITTETPVEPEGSSSTGGGRVGVKTRSTAS